MRSAYNAGLASLQHAEGISAEESALIRRLVEVLEGNAARNQMLANYYGGDISLKNIGVAVPEQNFQILAQDIKAHCDWAAIAVDRLADRSMFDGFVAAESVRTHLNELIDSAGIAAKYRSMLPMMLVHGCAFWTVGREGNRTVVRTHTAQSASALWDSAHDRILAALVIVGTAWDSSYNIEYITKVDIHTNSAIIQLSREADSSAVWHAEHMPHNLGRPMVEAFRYRPDERWHFGHSRISRQVRAITDSMMRESFRVELAAELNVLPQKYVAGLTSEQFDELMKDKFGHALGSMLLVQKEDPEDPNPLVGQFPQVSLQSHIDLKRDLAADFSGVTGVPMSELGITHDNPSSAEAIEAAERPLVNICERLNDDMRDALRNIALMMLAVDNGCALDALTNDERDISVHFTDPARPSLSAGTDRAIKIVSAAPAYAHTAQFWIDVGKDDGERRRIMDDLRRAEARAGAGLILDKSKTEVLTNAHDGGGIGEVS